MSKKLGSGLIGWILGTGQKKQMDAGENEGYQVQCFFNFFYAKKV